MLATVPLSTFASQSSAVESWPVLLPFSSREPVDLLSLLPAELPRTAAELDRDRRRVALLSLLPGEELAP